MGPICNLVVVSKIFYFHPEPEVEMIQFLGWNHQLPLEPKTMKNEGFNP